MLDSCRRTSARSFHDWLSNYLESSGFSPCSERTSRKWLTRDLGFRRHNRGKGVYFDGHDREDVQKYLHEHYLVTLSSLDARSRKYDGDEMEVEFQPEERALPEVRKFFHDESIFYTDDADKFYYARDGDQELRKKSQGRSLHVSDFISEACGFLDLKKILSQSELERLRAEGALPASLKSRVIIRPGKNADGWWDHDQLLQQVEHFIALFEIAFPGDVAAIIFDCSANHEAFAKDALVVNRMNVHPGGKQPLMRDTTFVPFAQRGLPEDQQERIVQRMSFDQSHELFPSMPKGMRTVAIERGLITAEERILGKCNACKDSASTSETPTVKCCLHRLLSQEPDFASEVSALKKLIDSKGHICLFLPKFHCELNPIECAWGQCKRICRSKCDSSWKNLQTRVPDTLDSIPLALIRKWFRLTDRFCDAYRRGLKGRLAEFATRKYRSHRRLPAEIVEAELQKEFDEEKQARMKRLEAK